MPSTTTAAADFAASAAYFPNPLQLFQFFDKYARFDPALGRRETWTETVDRTVAFLRTLGGSAISEAEYARIREGILTLQVMPSMRLLAMAGPAAERSHITIYNCSAVPVDSLDAFVEALLISMSGTGVGFSVEERFVSKLPPVALWPTDDRQEIPTLLVADTAEGWGEALRAGLHAWWAGRDITFDLSQIRPAGAPLRTKGGRASGPAPLYELLRFTRERIRARAGSRLSSLDAHDLMCAVGNAAVSGGMRRTAMLSLFDMDDEAMLHAKDGDFELENAQRWNANNSGVWPRDRVLTQQEVAAYLGSMVEGGRGEPGIFSRRAASATRPARRKDWDFLTNPCAEILLRDMEFCNLTNVVARAEDTEATLLAKVELATLIGTLQACATHFPGLRPQWRANCEEERLLGVSLDGQFDSRVARDPQVQQRLREHAVQVNAAYAQRLGINAAAAITCVKPSGNSSTMLGCAPGMHPRWAPYYIRNVRVSAHGPIYQVLRAAGVPMVPENGQDALTATTWVVGFPVKSPEGALTRHDLGAVEQCNYWLQVKRHYTEHNPSQTVTYRADEVIDLMKWVWDHQAEIGGLSFLPVFDAKYDNMPYVEISAAEYEARAAAFPEIDWSLLPAYELVDTTTSSSEVACASGACDVTFAPLSEAPMVA